MRKRRPARAGWPARATTRPPSRGSPPPPAPDSSRALSPSPLLSRAHSYEGGATTSRPDATAATPAQPALAAPVHCTDVCSGLNFATSATAPQRAHRTGCGLARRSSSRSTAISARFGRGLGRGLDLVPGPGPPGGQGLRDLRLPARHRPGGVDLELVPGDHLRLDVGDIGVELLVPAPQLVDRAVLRAQQRVVHPALVQPDLHVLLEADPDELRELGPEPGGLAIG